MAGKSSSAAERRYERHRRAGRGQGDGADYKPGIRVSEVPSLGRVSRMKVNGRLVHTLSDLETGCLAELRWNRDVSNIKEQFLLDRDITQRIAERLGVRHPTVPGDGAPLAMSTDIVFDLTIDGARTQQARAAKFTRDIDPHHPLNKKGLQGTMAILAKLEIERIYWTEKGVRWALLTDEDICKTRKANIEALLATGRLDVALGPLFWKDALVRVWKILEGGKDLPLSFVAAQLERAGDLSQANFMECIRHLCATRQLVFDLSVHLTPELKVSDFTIVRRPKSQTRNAVG